MGYPELLVNTNLRIKRGRPVIIEDIKLSVE
jgi:hypothetical protein